LNGYKRNEDMKKEMKKIFILIIKKLEFYELIRFHPNHGSKRKALDDATTIQS